MNGYDIEIDSPEEGYVLIDRWIKTLKNVRGMSCEIGVRRAGGTLIITNAFLQNGDPRVHIALDPYGNIPYRDIVGEHRSDYTNGMRNETLTELYRYARDNRLNILFFNLEDSEFFKRFGDGVPVYDEEKRIEFFYSFVHVDGQHDRDSVMLAAQFFLYRLSVGGIIIFDNVDHYDHTDIHKLLTENGFEWQETVVSKAVYKKLHEPHIHY